MTFDQATRVRLPLTTDTTALDAARRDAAAGVLRGTRGARRSARPTTGSTTLLQQADERTPERGTHRLLPRRRRADRAAEPPAPFTIDKRLISGGAVLGYGTTAGRSDEGDPVALRHDAATTSRIRRPGEDARSVIDEGTPAQHRPTSSACPTCTASRVTSSARRGRGIDLERFGTSDEIEQQKVRARRELYWPLLIGVAGIAAVGARRRPRRPWSRPAAGGRPAREHPTDPSPVRRRAAPTAGVRRRLPPARDVTGAPARRDLRAAAGALLLGSAPSSCCSSSSALRAADSLNLVHDADPRRLPGR